LYGLTHKVFHSRDVKWGSLSALGKTSLRGQFPLEEDDRNNVPQLACHKLKTTVEFNNTG